VPGDLAEDAVQDGLVRAHGPPLASDSEIALRAWLNTIVRNGAVSQLRRLRPSEQLDESINGVPQPPEIDGDRLIGDHQPLSGGTRRGGGPDRLDGGPKHDDCSGGAHHDTASRRCETRSSP